MNKKILIGSMLVLTLLLLMPSIPAIQHNVVKDEIEEKIQSRSTEDFDFRDIKELIDAGKLDRKKHLFLFIIVLFISLFRWNRFIQLVEISCEWYYTPFPEEIYYPLLLLRGLWLFTTVFFWNTFWNEISNKYGWNWGDIWDIIYN